MSAIPTVWACIGLALVATGVMIPVCVETRRRLEYLSMRVQSLVSQN